MPKTRLAIIITSVAILMLGVFAVGVATAPIIQPPPAPLNAEEPPTVEGEFKIFWEAWNLVDDHFVNRDDVDTKTRTYGAIQGMLDSLGDLGHTRFLSPDDLKDEQQMLAGRFEGIGAEIGVRDGHPTIIAPLDGSPAERAGIQAGDVILEVDGEDTSQMTLQEVIRHIRGPRGSTVHLSVIHPGQTVVTEMDIVRDEIKVTNVDWNYLSESAIAHIRISQFGANANTELVSALRAARSRGAQALIIDVRNDPGGLLDQAIDVTSQFLKSGVVLQEQDNSGKRRSYSVRGGGLATDLPIAVLINRGTGSAAEIFAGAIKDNQRGPVIGEKSFGTGTVLSTFNLSDGSALLLAVAEWLTPNGTFIKKEGIEPDVPVKPEANAVPLTPQRQRQMTESDILQADAQLRTAVEALRAKVPVQSR